MREPVLIAPSTQPCSPAFADALRQHDAGQLAKQAAAARLEVSATDLQVGLL